MRRVRIAGAAALFALILGSCASGPARVPQWVLSVPASDAATTWFTGSASIAGKDLAKAEEAATADLVASIMRYVGARVTVQSTAVARATVDSYQTDITQSVKTASDNRVAGFAIKDRYVVYDAKSGRSTVYILASYRTADLETEKKRIAALFAERADAVAQPEAEGDSLAARGRGWEAAGRYIAAAVAATGSDIDNAEVKIKRNLDKALAQVAELRVEIQPPSGAAYVGAPWPGPFTLRIVSGGASLGVGGAAVLVSYPRKQGTRVGQRSVALTADEAGGLSYLPPPPDFVGEGRLSARVDFSAWDGLLDSLPARWSAQTQALRAAFAAASADLAVKVGSRAASYPTAVALVDEAADGSPLPDGLATKALVEALAKAGLSTSSPSLDPSLLAKADDAALRQALAGGQAQRLVYGEARLLSSRNDGGTWIASVRVTARALDLGTGALLWSGEKQATGLGPDEATAQRTALREAGGNLLASELLSSLP